MAKPTYQELLDAGVHFGHLKRKWNPKMAPNIFMEKKGIHIIDLNRTGEGMERAANAMRSIAKSGKKIMFVATKKQARDIVEKAARSVNMPFVTDRWLGGMMTNFSTIRKSIKKMQNIQRMLNDPAVQITKKERLTLSREHERMTRVLGGIENLSKLPSAIFLVDIGHEHLALQEADRLGLRTFGMVDTNCDPNLVDFAIPANDDATRSIAMITNYLVDAIKEGLAERKENAAE
jgi:small subunit ribosomal protein S2